MRRLIVLISTIALFILAMAGCENADTTTTPDMNTPEIQADAVYESGGFDALMEWATDGQNSMPSDDSALKTSDPDTLTLSIRPEGGSGGYFYYLVKQDIQVSGEARAYYLPFEVTISDPNGWVLVASGIGDIYDDEPGPVAHGTGMEYGYPRSFHTKVGWDYPTYVTSGEYAWFRIRNASAFMSTKPTISVQWKDDGQTPTVLVRDENNQPIYDYVLID